jgi:FMN phosphatase YigB (HAD superfamily)
VRLKILSICNILLFFTPLFPVKTILWDVGGVLFQPNTLAIVTNVIGIKNPAIYYISALCYGKFPKGLQAQMYDLMYQKWGYQQVPERLKIRDNKGQELPQIMADWLDGKQTSHEISQEIGTLFTDLDQAGYFFNAAHKKTLESITSMMFNPQQLALNLKPIPQWCTLLQASIQAGNNNIIVSNFDRESFDCLFNSQNGKIVFAGIPKHNCVISAECGISKPNHGIFEYALQKYNLNPEECIFIDDQWENIQAAQEMKIGTVYVPTSNFENACKAIISKTAIA